MTRKQSVKLTLISSIMAAMILPVYVKEINLPVVLNTWPFKEASDRAYEVMKSGKSALDGVVEGITVCEMKPCANNPLNPNVGFGGKPNEEGETTLDAMIMDGATHSSAGVGCIKRIKNAIGVARAIMKYTTHSLMVGDDATKFAKSVGFPEEDLQTNNSRKVWNDWKNNKCQPNFWKTIVSGANDSCGPYKLPSRVKRQTPINKLQLDANNHDTIGMVAVDADGNVASGTSTNGLGYKIPGRVGDSPIAGAGSYADNDVGAAAATGNGDVMTRFLPTYQAVEFMRQGYTPKQASQLALLRIVKHYKQFSGSIIAVNKKGEYGVASYKWDIFTYSVRNPKLGESKVISDAPLDPSNIKQQQPACTTSNGVRLVVSSWILTILCAVFTTFY